MNFFLYIYQPNETTAIDNTDHSHPDELESSTSMDTSMDDKAHDRESYKIPTNNIIVGNRRKFYGLKKQNAETIEEWLERVFRHIDDCDFPTSIELNILADKFTCELNTEERDVIRKADSNWTMKCQVVSINKENHWKCSAFQFIF